MIGKITFGVVVKTCDTDYAVNFGIKEAKAGEVLISVAVPILLVLRTPVFYLSEIMLLGEDGREVCGIGRKPGKWSVEVEEFDDLDKAIERSMEVSAA